MSLVFCLALVQAGVHTTDLTFSRSQFRIEPATCGSQLAGQRYQVVLGEGMDVSDKPGAPQLPVEPVVIALPGHQSVTTVTFEVGEWKALGGECNVLPAQKQQVLVAGTDLAPKSKGKGQEPEAKAEGGVGFTAPLSLIHI